MGPSPADLRSEVARHQLTKYQLAARARMHPARLSAFLNEKLPLPPAIALRIQEAVRAEVADRLAR
jgi:hypothetical protein